MLKLNYFLKYFLILFCYVLFSSTSIAKDKHTFTLKELGLDTKEQERKKRNDKFLECMMSKIKPKSTDAHKSVVEEYCWNKVKKR